MARHIIQACPVWIHTQSNITQAPYTLFLAYPNSIGFYKHNVVPGNYVLWVNSDDAFSDKQNVTVVPGKNHCDVSFTSFKAHTRRDVEPYRSTGNILTYRHLFMMLFVIVTSLCVMH